MPRYVRSIAVIGVLAGACERVVPEPRPLETLPENVIDPQPGDRPARRPRPATTGCPQLKPSPPRPAASAAPALPRSSISVSIPLALATLQPEIDRLVPANLSDPGWPAT